MTPDCWITQFNRINWTDVSLISEDLRMKPVMPWLGDQSSLTARLKEHCSDFSVDVLHESTGQPDANEALLIPDADKVWVREVKLYGDNSPWVFARSVMPLATGNEQLIEIQGLNRRPLGEMLFANPALEIQRRLIGRIDADSNALGVEIRADQPIWGRRTLFKLEQLPLVVTEVFLPDSPAYR